MGGSNEWMSMLEGRQCALKRPNGICWPVMPRCSLPLPLLYGYRGKVKGQKAKGTERRGRTPDRRRAQSEIQGKSYNAVCVLDKA